MEESQLPSRSLHIAMYPWFAFGHITPYIHFANKLAKKGHKISFFIPKKTESKIKHFNKFPDLITFVPFTVPHVDGLPGGAENTADVASPQIPLIATAMDLTEPHIEILLRYLKPQVILFDFASWIPKLCNRLGIKTVHYSVVSAVTIAFNSSPARYLHGKVFSEDDLMNPPPGFPDSSIKIRRHEARDFFKRRAMQFGDDILFYDRIYKSLSECDALAFKACREIEGPFLEFLEKGFEKPVFLSGPVIPENQSSSSLDENWTEWLSEFEPGSVLYCAFGSEVSLSEHQIQELLLGFELTGFPFLFVTRSPIPLLEGFEERVGKRGKVHQGWVQQQLILEHSSVGCYFTHCGWGSIFEALVGDCELVLMPFLGDQIFNARLIANRLEAGIEVERSEEDGSFTRESVCEAIRTVMDRDRGEKVRANRARLTELLLREDLESSYVDDFSDRLCKFISH